MDENISRAAGANHGQMMTEGRFGEVVAPLRRTLMQRNTSYQHLSPVAGE
jgi:FO synthase